MKTSISFLLKLPHPGILWIVTSSLSKAANTSNRRAPLIILLTNIRSPSFNAGSIESEGILNEVKQNSCIKNRTTTMQNMKKAKFSNIARILFILLISSPLVESIYDKPLTLTHISHVRHFHPIIR